MIFIRVQLINQYPKMFSSIVLSLIACFFGFKLIQWLASYVRLCVVVNKIPGPFMVPLFGNVLSFSPSGFIHELVAISKRFSDHSIFRLWIGPHYWLVFHKPEPLEVKLSAGILILIK